MKHDCKEQIVAFDIKRIAKQLPRCPNCAGAVLYLLVKFLLRSAPNEQEFKLYQSAYVKLLAKEKFNAQKQTNETENRKAE